MITEIFSPVDAECEQSLIDIQRVLGSDVYLAGLGKLSIGHVIPKGFNVIKDYERCVYLLNSQEMWDEPDSNRRDQNFAEALDDAVDYLGYPTYDRKEAKRRMQYFKGAEKFSASREYIRETTNKAYDKNGVAEFMLNNFQGATSEKIKEFREYDLNGHIDNCFGRLIRAAYFGGLKKWPVSEHLLKCYSIGGFPTGWVGPLARNGGESKKCMQILHFGPAASSRP